MCTWRKLFDRSDDLTKCWVSPNMQFHTPPSPHCLVLHSGWNSWSEIPDYPSCQQQQQQQHYCPLHCSLLWEQWRWAACIGGLPCGLGYSGGIYSSRQAAWISAGPQAGSGPQPCHPAQPTVAEAGSYIPGPGTVA